MKVRSARSVFFFAACCLACVVAMGLGASFAHADEQETVAERGTGGDGNVYSYVVAGGKASITGVDTENTTDYVIPSVIDGFTVNSIEKFAFRDNATMTSITIPDTVRVIGDQAFVSATSLESVNLPENYSGALGDSMFWGCESLRDIAIPSGVTSIGSWAFYNCFSLESIAIPPMVSSIGKYAFNHDVDAGSSSLREVTFPGSELSSLTSIGSYAFKDCTKLESIELPTTLRSLGDEAFRSCESLETLVIPAGVVSFPERVFQRCASLKEVYLYGNVFAMEKDAFAFNANLERMYFLGDIRNITFASMPFEDSFKVTFYAYPECSDALAAYVSEVNTAQGKEAGVYELEVRDLNEVIDDIVVSGTSASSARPQAKTSVQEDSDRSGFSVSTVPFMVNCLVLLVMVAVCVAFVARWFLKARQHSASASGGAASLAVGQSGSVEPREVKQ